MKRGACIFFWLAGMVAVVSCSKRATFTPASRSVETREKVIASAVEWAAQDPNRYWATVQPTGSMEPFLNEHSIVLCVKYSGQHIQNGQVVIYKFSDELPNVIHVVTDQNATSFYMSGYANHGSDGWHPKESVRGILVGQLYLP